MGMIASGYGNGKKTLQLEEGRCYSFFFTFVYYEDDLTAKVTEENYSSIHFIIGIPLSHENRKLLLRAQKLAHNPEERVKDDLDSILKKQDAFDEKLQQGIELIKAKGLPPSEEERRIADFRDEAERVRERHGM